MTTLDIEYRYYESQGGRVKLARARIRVVDSDSR
jgi:hypothetical protein